MLQSLADRVLGCCADEKAESKDDKDHDDRVAESRVAF